jgi:hypothetical protein
MATQVVTLQLPENLYLRLQQIAQATQQPFDAVVLRAIQVGAPPSWEDAPAAFQGDLAALDRLDDDALWHMARSRQTEAEMARYQELLEQNASGIASCSGRYKLCCLAPLARLPHPLRRDVVTPL